MRAAPLAVAIALAGCSDSGAGGRLDAAAPSDAGPMAPGDAAPRIHVKSDPNYMDTVWCQIALVPEQDPVFPTIRRDAFEVSPDGIAVTPASWLAEAKTRVPELQAAADARGRELLDEGARLVGRPFIQRDFDFVMYFCPFFAGGTAIPGIYPIFPYLESAVGELQWPDWIFTDEYLFHEILHRYVLERVDYAEGTPILNELYGRLAGDTAFFESVTAYLGRAPTAEEQLSYIGLVLSHIHVYAIMTRAYRSLGEESNLDRIRTYETENARPHPSYVEAWSIVRAYGDGELDALLAEVK